MKRNDANDIAREKGVEGLRKILDETPDQAPAVEPEAKANGSRKPNKKAAKEPKAEKPKQGRAVDHSGLRALAGAGGRRRAARRSRVRRPILRRHERGERRRLRAVDPGRPHLRGVRHHRATVHRLAGRRMRKDDASGMARPRRTAGRGSRERFAGFHVPADRGHPADVPDRRSGHVPAAE